MCFVFCVSVQLLALWLDNLKTVSKIDLMHMSNKEFFCSFALMVYTFKLNNKTEGQKLKNNRAFELIKKSLRYPLLSPRC